MNIHTLVICASSVLPPLFHAKAALREQEATRLMHLPCPVVFMLTLNQRTGISIKVDYL